VWVTLISRRVSLSNVERFNRSYRESVLGAFLFELINPVKQETESWMEDYNNYHPHESLCDKTPVEYLQINGRPKEDRIKTEELVGSNSRETD
jgi:transposase InsO family protein